MSHVKKVMLSIFVTTKCNLDCLYCYANKGRSIHDHQTISFEFAKLGIEYYFKNFPQRHIRYFGAGEPTCETSLLKSINSYANSITKDKVTYELQTNGVFNTEIRDWLGENIDIIWVSFDGPPDVQNYYRPHFKTGKETSSVLEKNVSYLIKNGKGFTGVRVTINNKNIDRQIEMVDYFESLGVNCIWTDPLFPSVGYQPVCHSLNVEDVQPEIPLLKYVDNYEKAFNYAKGKGVFYGSFLGCNFDEKSIYNCRACIPAPHLTTDGYISACDMALFGKNANHMDPFIYGNWNKEKNELVFDELKMKTLQSRSVNNMPGCKGCIASENCAGYCLGEVLNETGNLFGQKKITCEAIRSLSKVIEMNQGCYPHLHP